MDLTTVSATTNRDAWAPLIERAKRLDPEALDEIVEKLAPRLFAFLFRLTGRRTEAEELVQEVFLRVVRWIDRYEHDGRFEPWLFRIASNAFRDRKRHERRHPPPASLDGGTEDGEVERGDDAALTDRDGPAPEAKVMREEDVDRLDRALQRLSEAEREVVLLRHYSGMSFEEIAVLMETPLGTALARAHRGLKKLREWMELST